MIDDSEPVDFCLQKVRSARKTHTCSECRRTIQVGEKYTHSSYGVEGIVQVNKTCSHCEIAGQWLQKHCGGYCFGQIQEELQEHYSDGYREDNLRELLVGVHRGWKAFDSDRLLPLPAGVAAVDAIGV